MSAVATPAAVSAPVAHAMQPGPVSSGQMPSASMQPGQIFQALDGAASAASSSAGPRVAPGAASLSVGYQDTRLGYVELQARQVGGSIQATLIPSSESAQHALQGQLGALGGWLAQRATPVERLAVASPAANLAGNAGRDAYAGSMRQGGGSGSAQPGDGQGSGSALAGNGGRQASSQDAASPSSARALQGMSAVRGAAPASTASSGVGHGSASGAVPGAGGANRFGASIRTTQVSPAEMAKTGPASVGQRISVHA